MNCKTCGGKTICGEFCSPGCQSANADEKQHNAEELILDFEEACDHLWLGNGKANPDRLEKYEQVRKRLLEALIRA